VAATAVATVVVAVALIVLVGGFTWRVRNFERAERAVSDARHYLDQGEYRKGLERTDEALALRPHSLEARVIRARLLIGQNHFQRAADEAQGLLEQDPNDWTAHLILAVAASKGLLSGIPADEHLKAVEVHAPATAEAHYLQAVLEDSDAEAVELLDRALELEPAHAPALYERMSRRAALKNFPAAMEDAERLALVRPRSAQGHRAVAWIHWKQYDFEQALAAVERAITLDPDAPLNYLMRARVHCRADPRLIAESMPGETASYQGGPEYEQCLADLTHAIELDPEIATYYYHRSRAYNAAGRRGEAITDARRAIELHPDHRLVYLPLFLAYRSLGQEEALREAVEQLRSAAEGWADRKARAWAHRVVAETYRQLGEDERALDEASRAIDLDPDDPWNYAIRVRIRRHVGDEEGFEADCDAVAALDLREPEVLDERGDILGWDCHRWETAMADFEVQVERYPNWYIVHSSRGVANVFLGRLEEALADFTRTIELAPKYARAYGNRAVVYARLNRFEEALADHEKAVELNPYDAHLRSNLASSKKDFGRVEEALADVDKAIELDPLWALAHVIRGDALAILGDCDGAMDELSRELAPKDSQNQGNLAGIHIGTLYYFCPDRCDPAAALDWASRALESTPEEANAVSNYGAALYRNRRYSEAREHLMKAVRISGQPSPWQSFFLAMCSWRLGQKNEARSYFENGATFMDEHNLANPSLIRLRQEAAELLGIEE
jgi:tetratricopeptide (TPR) repeat protein